LNLELYFQKTPIISPFLHNLIEKFNGFLFYSLILRCRGLNQYNPIGKFSYYWIRNSFCWY